ncbi:MAG: InlB B-repeat-containing protein [Bacteroidales bacterium]|nr:InlB B-repeat-containing protein [Bacteroidales bacterium]
MRQKHLFSIVALLTLLAVGQMAWATVTGPCTFKGRSITNGQTSQHIFGVDGLRGEWNTNIVDGTSQTFNSQTIDLGQGSITITGTLNFTESTSFTDVTTAGQVTLVFESSNYWFYGATVKTLSDASVSGCTVSSISSNRHTITVTIPSGKTFGKVYLEFVQKEPMPSNTTVTVPAGDYWVSDSSHKPKPEPTVTYNGTTLIKGTDYTIDSWSNNSSAGTGTVTVTGMGEYAGTATGTFPIRWATYKVHFDKNHSDATGTMPDQDFTYQTAQNLTANAFNRNYYIVAGWSTTPEGSLIYTDQESVKNLIAEDNATFTLYAKWTPVSYAITYDLAGGSEVTANPTSYNIETASFTLNNPTRQGYTFAGWTGTGLSDVTETVTITTGSTGERSYTANWTPTDYNISYNLAGGEVETANPTSYNIETASFTLNNPTRLGYTFAGWTGTGLSEATQTVTIETGSTGQRSYTAKWTPVTYNITYDLASGEVEIANPTSYNIETPSFTLKNPTRPWYYFAGWTGTGLSEATQTVTITTGSIGDRHYIANWVFMPGNQVSYIDENGKAKTAMAVSLTGNETEIGIDNEDTWYAVDSDITYDHQLILLGSVHLILCDGKTMTVPPTTTGTGINGYYIYGEEAFLSIYGQSGGTGDLTVTNNAGGGIGADRLTINGGHIKSTAKDDALYAVNQITINDGVITATSSGKNSIACYERYSADKYITINGGVVTATSNGGRAIYCYSLDKCDITINGGIVTATGVDYGIFCSATRPYLNILGGQVKANIIRNGGGGTVMNFGYTNANDYIEIVDKIASSSSVTIVSGQIMTDGTNTYSGHLSSAQIDALARKTLRPCGEPSVDLTLVQGEKDGVTCYWGTFYYGVQRYTLPEGAVAYTMGADHKLYRLGTDGSVIPAGVAVVIIAEKSEITLTKSDETSVIDIHGEGNILRGSGVATTVNNGKITEGGQQKTPYVLSVKNGTVDFYPLSSDFNGSIPANKAYYLQ